MRAATMAAGLVLAVFLLAVPAAADADDAPAQVPPQAALAAAEQALDPGAAPDQAPAAEAVATADPSLALRDLALALPRLEGADRRRAKAILARPTDGRDPLGNSYGVPEAPPYCTAHFCVHYVTTTKDAPDLTDLGGALGVPDYVEKIDVAAETSYAIENGQIGWRPPKPDGNLGGNSLTDIYLADVGGQGLFGYSAPDPSPAQRCVRSCFAYLVMDNDYAGPVYGYADPQIPLEVTIAHEYNHVLQFRVDARTDGWLFESTAVWTEDRVFPNDNDYVRTYLGIFARTPQVPITDYNGAHGFRIYGLSTFNHFLDRVRGYGPSVILGAWDLAPRANPADFAAAAMDKSIKKHGGPGFGAEFTRFAAATAEWRSLGFPDATLYPDVTRKGGLHKSRHGKRITLDHMAYRLFDVRPQGGGELKLTVSAGSVRAGLALVGHSASGGVVMKTKFLKGGGRGSVTLASPGDFDRVTAVIVNSDFRISGFDQIHRDWNYTRDNAKITARLSG
ncbi:MAG: MXAN_6640 family putative metalloprotease [Solirubrobacterales bacterium]